MTCRSALSRASSMSALCSGRNANGQESRAAPDMRASSTCTSCAGASSSATTQNSWVPWKLRGRSNRTGHAATTRTARPCSGPDHALPWLQRPTQRPGVTASQRSLRHSRSASVARLSSSALSCSNEPIVRRSTLRTRMPARWGAALRAMRAMSSTRLPPLRALAGSAASAASSRCLRTPAAARRRSTGTATGTENARG